MSMILDALRRSRAETGAGTAVPGIDTDHAVLAESDSGRGSSRGLVVLLLSIVAVLLIAVVVMALYLWNRSTGLTDAQADGGGAAELTQKQPVGEGAMPELGAIAGPSRETGANASTSLEPARREKAAAERTKLEKAALEQAALERTKKDVVDQGLVPSSPNIASQPLAAITPANADHVAALYARPQVMQQDQSPRENASGRASGTGAESVQASDASVNSIRSPLAGSTAQSGGEVASSAGDVSATAEEVIDVEEVLRRAQAALGESPLEPHPAPLLENLSQQVKDNIPSIMYSRHVWGDDRTAEVVLNGQRLRAGQRHQGFVVKEILSDSVVLSWGGTDFRLRALNSWINL